jgi:hypothetical protein
MMLSFLLKYAVVNLHHACHILIGHAAKQAFITHIASADCNKQLHALNN